MNLIMLNDITTDVILTRWSAPCEMCLRVCSDAQSELGLQFPLSESLDTTECIKGKQRLRRYFAHAQNELKLRILCTFEGTFLA